MKIKVVKDMFYVSEDLTMIGIVDKDTLEKSYIQFLYTGDVYEKIDDDSFICIEGKLKGQVNEGWGYDDYEDFFEEIDE